MSVGGDLKGGHVGVPLPAVEVKLADVPDMELVASRDNKGEVIYSTQSYPLSYSCLTLPFFIIFWQICARGASCISGYFKNPERTAELIDKDGWLHTGDVGIWIDGSLKVVDRCKHIFKLAQGEYVAPEKVEQVYQQSGLVTQVFVDGDTLSNFPVALVVPELEPLLAAIPKATSNGVSHKGDAVPVNKPTIEELCADPEAKKALLLEFKRLGIDANLLGFEKASLLYDILFGVP